MSRVEAGDEVTITRRGKRVAVLRAAVSSRVPVNAAELGALTSTLPRQTEAAADLVRAMREDERY